MARPNPYATGLDRNAANHTPLTPLSLVARAAFIYPEQPAVVHGERRYTWSQTYARCRRLASALVRAGIGPGDTVAVMAANTPEMFDAHFGVPMSGAVLQENNFAVATSEAFIGFVKKVTVPISIVLTIIASIDLVVGGIGVMNIMLISVTERTREIGVRRAIGAGRGDIMLQFLVESGTLTGIGGVIGVVFGTLLAFLVSKAIHFPFYFSVPWTVIALVFSVLVGVGFGIYPARRAGDMDPVTALRYE